MARFEIEWVSCGVFVARFVDGVFAGRQFGLTVCEAVKQFGIKPELARF